MKVVSKHGEVRLNPRSIGYSNEQVYCKSTDQLCLAQEALEIKRCMSFGIQTQHILTVEHVDYIQETNTLITNKIQGAGLYQTLWNSTHWLGLLRGVKFQNTNLLFDRIAELGEWLRLYHDSSKEPEADGVAALWVKNSFELKLNTLYQAGLIPRDLLEGVMAKFVAPLSNLHMAEYLKNNRIMTCQVHGDFIIYNIIVGHDNNLHILDFGDTRRGSNVEDVARMYSSLWAIAQTSSSRKRLIEPILQRFLSSYGYDDSIIQTEFFKCNLAYNFIVHMSGQHAMKGMVSWNSMRELNKITQVGMKWIKSELK